MSVTHFRVDVSEDVLADLRDRIRRTRFTPASSPEPWAAGTDPAYLRSLLTYWADGFDWRTAEDELNRLPHHLADIGGQRIHFVHVRAAGGRPALPLILTHGWPSSFVEMLPLVPLLTDPARFGGDPADAFDVVIPSLPGFLFSDLPPGRPMTERSEGIKGTAAVVTPSDVGGPMTRQSTAETWHALMTEELGYARYGAFGGDIGAGVTTWLGALYPESVAGIHLIHPGMPAEPGDLTDAERAWLAAVEAFDEKDGGYSEIMLTRPDTIAAALQDSPAGLAAWIVDKYRAWSDCGGDLESRFDRDDMLTVLTLYWATGTIGSSFRQYYDWPLSPPRPVVPVPAGVTLSAEPVLRDMPRSLAERGFTDLRQWRGPTVGGHFLPMEEPALLAGDLRTLFRPLR
ncbi:epoxide hydrolase family protein [Actinoallomurus iriomotensis]|uniref:Multidrug MFS transporter n=1 Tax=Actinoallomurus iriomotensis TaxID=478107 RepID=A0A9W6RCF3_9ACTN|nr:epoxide hydrolase [Actinoallomurus iriomotensis]GLY73426.1 multidrug MFS transporter [Actinoallomurus iriomotensis]